MYDNLPFGILILNSQGTILSCDKTAAEFLGFSSAKDCLSHCKQINHLLEDPIMRTGFETWLWNDTDRSAFPFVSPKNKAPIMAIGKKIKASQSKGKTASVVLSPPIPLKDSRSPQERDPLKFNSTSLSGFAEATAKQFSYFLRIILGYTELVLEDQPAGAESRDDLQEVFDAAQTAKRISDGLLAFSGKKSSVEEKLDLNQEVESQIEVLKGRIGSKLEIRWEPINEPLTILFDRTHLIQIVTELCENAIHAMEGKGTLYLTTEKKPGEPAFAQLQITDTGPGLPKEVRECLFEPFCTTHYPREGKGLGLPSAYGMVKQHGGSIDLFSKPDSGTTCEIQFPLYSG